MTELQVCMEFMLHNTITHQQIYTYVYNPFICKSSAQQLLVSFVSSELEVQQKTLGYLQVSQPMEKLKQQFYNELYIFPIMHYPACNRVKNDYLFVFSKFLQVTCKRWFQVVVFWKSKWLISLLKKFWHIEP